MGKDLKELAGDVVKAVFDLSNYLEETEVLDIGIPREEKRVQKLVSKALKDYPQSQIDLVLECLNAVGDMDTAGEAEASMRNTEEEDHSDPRPPLNSAG